MGFQHIVFFCIDIITNYTTLSKILNLLLFSATLRDFPSYRELVGCVVGFDDHFARVERRRDG